MGFDQQHFDWTLALPTQPANPIDLEGSGAICETKRFDSFYNSYGDRVILPAGKKYTSKSSRANESALTVTNYWDKEQDLEKSVLEIKSPSMKSALKAVIPEYATFNIGVKNITITGAPYCLFHYRDELMAYGREMFENQDLEAAQHIQHLIVYMWEVFTAEIAAFNALKFLADFEPALVHDYLWMVFRPGDLVYVRAEPPWAFQLERLSKGAKSWQLHGFLIRYSGEHFGFADVSVGIDHYEGLKPLNELSAIPFDGLAEEERQNKRETLIARGRKYVSIHGKSCFWYENISAFSCRWMNTRVMADHEGWVSSTFGYRIPLSDNKKKYKPEDALQCLGEDGLTICFHKFAGYSLRENEWGMFYIDGIREVSYDREAFDHLILPKDQKQQLLSLVRVHGDDEFSFDDLIKGKGKGMTFLLYGDPGLGKTLTAESVADYCQKPLLRLDAGTLGTSPKSVEEGLKNAFNLAERWHALLLLDEADVYLEQRRSRNLTHNGVISVFLRMIEYYHGILFLTTNRISAFDTAFISRIHLAIYYPPLSQSSRSRLLYTFLKQTSQESAEGLRKDGSLKRIAKEKLNGRQIKNLVRAACAVARGDSTADGKICSRHLETASRPMTVFRRVMERAKLNEEGRISDTKEDLEQEEQDDVANSDEDEGSYEGEEDYDDDDDDGDDDEEEQRGRGEFEESEIEIDLTGEQDVEVGMESGSDDGDEDESDGNDAFQQTKRRRLI